MKRTQPYPVFAVYIVYYLDFHSSGLIRPMLKVKLDEAVSYPQARLNPDGEGSYKERAALEHFSL